MVVVVPPVVVVVVPPIVVVVVPPLVVVVVVPAVVVVVVDVVVVDVVLPEVVVVVTTICTTSRSKHISQRATTPGAISTNLYPLLRCPSAICCFKMRI